MLTDRYLHGVPAGSRAAKGGPLQPHFLSPENLGHIRALDGIARRRGQSLAQLALAWALRDARITAVLLGASSPAQLDENLAALDRLDLSEQELTEIDAHAVDAGINIWAPRSSDL